MEEDLFDLLDVYIVKNMIEDTEIKAIEKFLEFVQESIDFLPPE